MVSRVLKLQKAFTLVEILVVSVVLSLFLGGVYAIFSGGQRVAAKTSWLQYTIDRLRFTQKAIFKSIKTSSYPSSILPSNIYDAGKTETNPGANASNYFVRIGPGVGKKSAKDIIKSNNGVFLVTARSEPEVRDFQDLSENQKGKITWSIFSLRTSPKDSDLGIIYMEERIDEYTTVPPNYADALNRNYKSAKSRVTFKLAEDIEWIDFQATPGYNPGEITITLSASYYRERNLTRQSVIKVVPNVGVKSGL
jgi:prepilin-type N-terminal cleavage/methylation domain-containing protein